MSLEGWEKGLSMTALCKSYSNTNFQVIFHRHMCQNSYHRNEIQHLNILPKVKKGQLALPKEKVNHNRANQLNPKYKCSLKSGAGSLILNNGDLRSFKV